MNITRPRSRARRAVLAAFAVPLLATGPCLTTAENSLIDGFFDAVTAQAVADLREELGLPALTTTGSTTTATGTTTTS